MRDDSQETRLTIGTMPFGLVDYIVKFFGLDSTNNLVCEQDYVQWQETMYAKFRAQWVCMHRSPTSEYEEENLDDSGHLQRNVDAATLIYQDQADSVSTTASSASGLISLSPEDRISPQPGQYMDILSQAMALTGITESAVDIDDMPIIAPCESGPTVSESPSLL